MKNLRDEKHSYNRQYPNVRRDDQINLRLAAVKWLECERTPRQVLGVQKCWLVKRQCGETHSSQSTSDSIPWVPWNQLIACPKQSRMLCSWNATRARKCHKIIRDARLLGSYWKSQGNSFKPCTGEVVVQPHVIGICGKNGESWRKLPWAYKMQ